MDVYNDLLKRVIMLIVLFTLLFSTLIFTNQARADTREIQPLVSTTAQFSLLIITTTQELKLL